LSFLPALVGAKARKPHGASSQITSCAFSYASARSSLSAVPNAFSISAFTSSLSKNATLYEAGGKFSSPPISGRKPQSASPVEDDQPSSDISTSSSSGSSTSHRVSDNVRDSIEVTSKSLFTSDNCCWMNSAALIASEVFPDHIFASNPSS